MEEFWFAKFSYGRRLITRGARQKLSAFDQERALRRHLTCDWGEVCESDKALNDLALKSGERLISAYRSEQGVKFWIITEADRSCTTILLPSEY